MADSSTFHDANLDSADRQTTGTSRWQKRVGITALVVVPLLLVVLFRGGVMEPGGGAGGHRPPAGIPQHGDQRP